MQGKEVKSKKQKVNEQEIVTRRMTRGQMKTRIRIGESGALRMASMMVDKLVSAAIRVQCDDDLFGYPSFTYLSFEDFEAVFTLDQLTGSVITSYIMCLYEQVTNGPARKSGICFVSPTATIVSGDRKLKTKNIDDASRHVAERITHIKDNGIIMLPFNPGNHWTLAVLDMKTFCCYYLDSLRPSNVNPMLKQIVDAAMLLYNVQSGSNRRVNKLSWVNAQCPLQPGSTECGYYVLKFMKEIVEGGVEILVNDNVGGKKERYTDTDIDAIREEWCSYVATFIFR